jgi:hypothetical protein
LSARYVLVLGKGKEKKKEERQIQKDRTKRFESYVK